METLIALAIVAALGFAQRFLYGFDHRWIMGRYEVLLRSLESDPHLSVRGRPTAVHSGWYLAFWGAVGAQFFLFVWWLIIADSVAQQAVKLFAYLAAFFTAVGIAALSFEAATLYRSYRQLRRQAEADRPR